MCRDNRATNPAAAVDAPIAFVLHTVHFWRRATAQRRLGKEMAKLAIIGPSGAGKSNLLKTLRGDDMDRSLDTSVPQPATVMLDCILKSPSSIITVSVHKDGLKEMAEMKSARTDHRFSEIRFVYLFCTKAVLEKRLRSQDRSGRDVGTIEWTLKDFEEMDGVFRRIADIVIDTSSTPSASVADQVKELAS